MTLLVSPAPRWSAVMAELPTSSELVLFGGKTTHNSFNGISSLNGVLNDTWAWTGAAWTNLSTGISGSSLTAPLPRYEAAMAFDGTYVTMVGGTNGIENLSSTWSYNTSAGWFQQNLTPVVSPPSNFTIPISMRGMAMAYQSSISGGEAVLFGGTSAFQRHYVLDTWVWVKGNPGTWTELSPASYPSGRIYPAMASSSTTAVLFGGKNFDGGLSDTWTWNGSNWTASSATGPSARYGAMMAYDGYTSQWVLFGGITVNGFNNETWTFNGATWTQQTSGPAPTGRAFGSMAFHTASNSVVMFGGLTYDHCLNDTWTWNGSVWTKL